MRTCNSGSVEVAPVRERGLKLLCLICIYDSICVAPVRERGLKSGGECDELYAVSRSRKGAWIEMHAVAKSFTSTGSLP